MHRAHILTILSTLSVSGVVQREGSKLGLQTQTGYMDWQPELYCGLDVRLCICYQNISVSSHLEMRRALVASL